MHQDQSKNQVRTAYQADMENLKTGYVEDWQHHAIRSGTPQGGIILPIFVNLISLSQD